MERGKQHDIQLRNVIPIQRDKQVHGICVLVFNHDRPPLEFYWAALFSVNTEGKTSVLHGRPTASRSLLVQRQINGKAAPLLRLAIHLNASFRQFYDPMDDRKPQAKTLLFILRRALIVFLKNVGLDLRRHA